MAHKLPAISDLQLEGYDLTRPAFYPFTDYLLNKSIDAIQDIVKDITTKLFRKNFNTNEKVRHYTHSLKLI